MHYRSFRDSREKRCLECTPRFQTKKSGVQENSEESEETKKAIRRRDEVLPDWVRGLVRRHVIWTQAPAFCIVTTMVIFVLRTGLFLYQ